MRVGIALGALIAFLVARIGRNALRILDTCEPWK